MDNPLPKQTPKTTEEWLHDKSVFQEQEDAENEAILQMLVNGSLPDSKVKGFLPKDRKATRADWDDARYLTREWDALSDTGTVDEWEAAGVPRQNPHLARRLAGYGFTPATAANRHPRHRDTTEMVSPVDLAKEHPRDLQSFHDALDEAQFEYSVSPSAQRSGWFLWTDRP
ncbi:MAG: hypothetical protein R2720_04460 [Candidatus Nanopelagicales bacterium]